MTARPTGLQKAGLYAWAALIGVQLLWYTMYPPVSIPAWVALLITVPPLLLPLLALRNITRALLWVGILALFYFCHGVSEAWSSTGDRWLAFVELALCLLLIGTLGAGVRKR